MSSSATTSTKTKEQHSSPRRGHKRTKSDGNGAIGPNDEFLEFPEYDADEEPRECKKAFTLFCKASRKDVKRSLGPLEDTSKVRMSFHFYW
jgi:hypothetical protein